MYNFFIHIITFFTNFQGQFLIAELLFISYLKCRKYFLARFIGCIIVYLVVSYVIFFTSLFKYLSFLNYAILFVLSIFILVYCFKINIWNSLFYATAAYCMQHSVYSVAGIFQLSLNYKWDSWQNRLANIMISAALYALFYFIFVKRIKKEERIQINNKQLIVISAVTISIVYVISIWVRGDIFHMMYAVSCCFLLLFIQFSLFERNKLQNEKKIIQQMLFKEQQQHKISKENIEMINRKCHDLKHQVSALRTIENAKIRNQTIEELEKAILIYDSAPKTGNEDLDIVLTEKSLYCAEKNIKLHCTADGNKLSFMNTVDIYSLFGNALDNAIESVESISDMEKRNIVLNISARNSILGIHIENYYEKPLTFADGLPVTTKENKQYHGFGMKSIRYIVEKYGGTMTVLTENNFFYLNIIFHI